MDRASSAKDFDPKTHPVPPQSPTRHEEYTHSPDDAPRPDSPDTTQDGGATRTATPEPDSPDAQDATEKKGAAQAAPPERPSGEAWLADELAKDAAAEAARGARLARLTDGKLKYKKANISELLCQLKIYCM
jgi:hypothetical protein